MHCFASVRNFSTIFYIFVKIKYAYCTIETALICHSHVQVVHRDTAATLGSFSNPFFSWKQKKNVLHYFSFTGHYTTATFVNRFNLKNLTVCSVTSIDTCLSVYMKVLFGDFPLSWKCLKDKSATITTVEKCSKTLTFPQHAFNLHVHPDCIYHLATDIYVRLREFIILYRVFLIIMQLYSILALNEKCAVEN